MTTTNRPSPIFVLAALASMGLVACGDDENPPSADTGADTTTEDVGMGDTGTEDTGMEDTGTEDTGTEDTGMEDTGTEDTGMEDTGTEDTGTEGSTIVELAIATDFLSTLVDAVVAADLADTLSGEGPFTVFAPTNDAFAALFAELEITPEELLADTETLTEVLLYHVVPESLASGDVAASDALEPLGGGELIVTIEGDTVFINDAEITLVDIEATNGYVHVIDTVLLPFADEGPNIVEIAEENGNFTILLAAAEAAGITDLAATTQDITLFAPTDAAFEEAFLALGVTPEELLASPDLGGILAYHVVPERLFAEDVVAASLLPTLAGIDLKVVVGDEVTVGGAVVSGLDIEGSNGVIHIVDSVILPPGTVVDVAIAGMFDTLVAAVVAADLVDTLSGEGPFTVFAPSEQAFADALEALGLTPAELLASPDLAAILTYHVVAERLAAADVVALDSVTTVNGASATITVSADGAMIEGANIVATDIPTSNGIIHVIDAVILPPAE